MSNNRITGEMKNQTTIFKTIINQSLPELKIQFKFWPTLKLMIIALSLSFSIYRYIYLYLSMFISTSIYLSIYLYSLHARCPVDFHFNYLILLKFSFGFFSLLFLAVKFLIFLQSVCSSACFHPVNKYR